MREKVGVSVAKDLINMGVTLTPERYKVWFMHRSQEVAALSRRIEDHVAGGGVITGALLDSLASAFADDRAEGGAMVERARALGQSSGALVQLNAKLAGAMEEFDASTRKSAAALENPELNRDGVAAIVRATVENAKGALAKTKAIGEDLAEATKSIEATHASIAAAQEAAAIDPLTGLSNRVDFMRRLEGALTQASERDRQVSLLMADIDDFDMINDRWGRKVGDNVIGLLSRKITELVGDDDLVARFGGDEFAILLTGAASEDAMRIAEDIRQSVAKAQITRRKTGESLDAITLSIGVACGEPDAVPVGLVDAAFAALDEAKRAGRSHVALFGSEARESAGAEPQDRRLPAEQRAAS